MGEGLGGWYKASLKYTEQPPLSHFNMADAATWVRLIHAGVVGIAIILSFSSLVSERKVHDTTRRSTTTAATHPLPSFSPV